MTKDCLQSVCSTVLVIYPAVSLNLLSKLTIETDMTQKEKALRFQELHKRPGVLLLPNPWDAGSARILNGLGFEALATSSGAAAGIFGRRDGYFTRDEALESVRSVVNAT